MTDEKAHNPKAYRPDVDGLRAVAILSVLVYHAFPQVLSGGFVGVDVFFVISGYLISRIIISELNAGTFTFANFYSRRIRRIFPALFIVLACVTLFGWYVLLPADFRQLGGHVFAGAGFLANILLWIEVGYFDTAAELKPLLHLWSLGIEEQYYLVWPLLLIGFRQHTGHILWLIVVIALISFGINVWATPRYPDAAFYLPPPRFWQLMVGGILAFWHVNRLRPWESVSWMADHRWVREFLSIGGFTIVLAGFVLIEAGRDFPGWWALLPTMGTAMLIAAGQSASINRTILSHRIAIYIGLISYPLYLWHWPLLSFSRVLNGDEAVAPAVRMVLLAVSVLLAIATYEFVEKNVRYARRSRWAPGVVPALSAAMAAVAMIGILAAGERATARSATVPNLAAVSYAFDDWQDFNGSGLFSGTSERKVLFLGDSHMAQYMPRIEHIVDAGPGVTRTAGYHISYGCAPVPGVDRRGRNCQSFVDRGYEAANAENVDVVVIGASWLGLISRDDLYRIDDGPGVLFDAAAEDTTWMWSGLEEQVRALVAAGKQVALILNAPVGDEFNPRSMVIRDGLDLNLVMSPPQARSRITAMNMPVNAPLLEIAARTGAKVVDPVDVVCSPETCPTTDDDGRPLYKDHSHFRASFVRENFDVLDQFVVFETGPGTRQADATL